MNNNLEALMVKQILVSAKLESTYACMNNRASDVNRVLLEAKLLQGILDESGVFGIAGGVWYDMKVKDLLNSLEKLDALSTDKGTGTTDVISLASTILDNVENLNEYYHFA